MQRPVLPKATAAERRRERLLLDLAAMADTLFDDYDRPAQRRWQCPACARVAQRLAAVDPDAAASK